MLDAKSSIFELTQRKTCRLQPRSIRTLLPSFFSLVRFGIRSEEEEKLRRNEGEREREILATSKRVALNTVGEEQTAEGGIRKFNKTFHSHFLCRLIHHEIINVQKIDECLGCT